MTAYVVRMSDWSSDVCSAYLSHICAVVDCTLSSTAGGGTGKNINAIVNAPIVTDQLAVRAVGYYDYSPGWIDNPNLGRNTNDGKLYGGRIQVRWTPAENLDIVAGEIGRAHV